MTTTPVEGFFNIIIFLFLIIGLVKPSILEKVFKRKITRGKVILFSFLAFFVLTMFTMDWSTTETINNNSANNGSSLVSGQESIIEEPKEPEYLLQLESFNCYEEYGYFHITGEVTNISNRSLSNIEAVGGMYTEEGEFVKSDSALIDYNPILSNQTSPFTIISTMNPAISKCNVNFKNLMGGTISTKSTDELK
jgi:hypothetical protein